jgi:SOS-response transcriptional repressor LexA
MSVTTEPVLSRCCLRVDDDAMAAAGLLHGSLVTLEHPTEYIKPGQVAAIILTSGRTMVRFIDSCTADFITVRATNHDSQPETFHRKEMLRMSRVVEARTVFM